MIQQDGFEVQAVFMKTTACGFSKDAPQTYPCAASAEGRLRGQTRAAVFKGCTTGRGKRAWLLAAPRARLLERSCSTWQTSRLELQLNVAWAIVFPTRKEGLPLLAAQRKGLPAAVDSSSGPRAARCGGAGAEKSL